MKKLYILIFSFLMTLSLNAQLQTGDIVFTGYNGDNPDAFSFLSLVEIPAGTQIEFSDNGWFATGGFRTNEGTGTWTSPTGGIPAGTEIIISDISGTVNLGTYTNSGVNFSTSGDQLFAYDPNNIPDASDDSGFYAGLQMNGAWEIDATSSNTSSQPLSLVGFSIAIDPEQDNAAYDCSTTMGDASTLRTEINNPVNWDTSNDTGVILLGQCSFNQTLNVIGFNIDTELSLYPNPTSTGMVTISSGNNAPIRISVYDVLGKEVKNATILNNRLNVSDLKSGVYILRLTQDNATTTKKLVIR